MNKKCYFVIFSVIQQAFVVVSELAKMLGKGKNKGKSKGQNNRQNGINAGSTAIYTIALLSFFTQAIANTNSQTLIIQADPSASPNQRAVVLQTANGVPQVNIQTPNEKGLSYNRYRQFDIDTQGAILNNSRKQTQTQLSGWIQGNPYLATGEAKTIINEVNATKASQLKGYMEVAGQKADVIIANPSGIHCNGCGVINASTTTLTTGQPQINQGQLEHIVVQKGVIDVSGQGLDNSQSDYTEILAREVQANAGIWASKGLDVVTGQNKIAKKSHKKTPQIQPLTAHSDNSPQLKEGYAVDIAKLGGMYADKIYLIGTESGLGVRNAGQVGASVGEAIIDVNGKVVNTGTIQAKENIDLKAYQQIEHSGVLYTQSGNVKLASQTQHIEQKGNVVAKGKQKNKGDIQFQAKTKIVQQGNTFAQGDINYSTQHINSSHNAIIAVGVVFKPQNKEEHKTLASYSDNGNNLNLQATKQAELQGKHLASNLLIVEAPLLNISASQNQANHIHLNASKRLDAQEQHSYAAKNIQINTPELNHQRGKMFANQINIESTLVDNREGLISALRDFNGNVSQQWQNQKGKLFALQNLTLQGEQLNLNNQRGEIATNGELIFNLQKLQGESHIQAQNATIRLKQDFHLNEAFKINKNLDFATEGNFSNGTILRVGNQLHIKAKQVDNQNDAEISATNTQIQSSNLLNQGLIDGDKTHLISQTLMNLGSGRIYGNHLAIQSERLENLENTTESGTKSAVIAARQRLDLAVGELVNRNESALISLGDIFIGKHLNPHQKAEGYADRIENANGLIEAQGNIQIYARQLLNQHHHLKTDIQEVSRENIYEYRPANGSVRYLRGTEGVRVEKEQNKGGGGVFGNTKVRDLYYLRLADKSKHYNWLEYDYLRTIRETQVLPPAYHEARILSAGYIDFGETSVENQDSKIIAEGNITFKGASGLTNRETKGVKITNEQGYVYYKTKGRKCVKRILGKCVDRADTTLTSTQVYQPSDITESISLGVWEYADNAGNRLNLVQDPKRTHIENKQQGSVYSQLNSNVEITNIPFANSSLYKINPEANKHYLIETDPRFTDRKRWLSSDYMYAQLRSDHNIVHKRLGDGYYEQRLVNEQINQLTGRRYLDGYQSDLEQFKGLMEAGVIYAKKFNLTLGVALSEAQVKELTTDMLWLVSKTVQIKGQTHTVLVPQVYLVPRNVNVRTNGALISANQIVAEIDGDIQNEGKLFGKKRIALSGQNFRNHMGELSSEEIHLRAKGQLEHSAGDLQADKQLTLQGKNILVESQISTSEKNEDFYREKLTTKGKISVNDKQGTLVLLAQEDITLKGAQIDNSGQTEIIAGNQLNLTNFSIKQRERLDFSEGNYAYLETENAVNNQLNLLGNATLLGKGAIHIEGATIHSDNKLSLQSKGDILIKEGRYREKVSSGAESSSEVFLMKEKVKTTHKHDYDLAQGSQIDAKNIHVQSDGALVVVGSQLVAENNLIGNAQNIVFREAENRVFEEDTHQVRKSGLLGSGGQFGFTVGSRTETTEQDQTKLYAQQSLVGSLNGNTNLVANKQYKQQASSVTAKQGDVSIIAKQVDVLAADDKYETHSKYTYEQKGLTLALNVPALQAIQGAIGTVKSIQKVGESNNNRINALAAANAGFSALRSFEGLGSAMDATKALANGDMKNANISVSITYGKQKNQQQTDIQGNTAHASQINAGGQVNLIAQGDKTHSDINIIGSDVSGKKGTALLADNNINLLAAEQTHQERSTNKSSGWNAGVAISYGQNGFAFGVTAGGNYGKGYGNGDETSWRGSRIGDKHSHTTIHSQADTNIKGSQVSGEKVSLKAENLNIESLQDTMTYKGKQQQVQGQVTVGYGVSASASYNRSKVNADYASVTTQAGIFAGSEGYNVNVGKHTDLKGAVILSSAEKDKNRLTTQDFTYSDIQNHSSASASSMGLAGGLSIDRDQTSAEDKALNKQYREGREGETFTQANQNQANASRLKFGLSDKDVHSADGYAMAKLGLANALSNSKESESKNSTTSSMLSEGIFNVQSEQGQQNVLSIKKSTQEQTNKLEKINHSKLQKNVENDVATIQEFARNVAGLTDEAYRTMFIAEHRMMTFVTDENGVPEEDSDRVNQLKNEARQDAIAKGITDPEKISEHIDTYYSKAIGKGYNIYKLHELSDQERQNIKPVTYINPNTGKEETKYVVAFNGIMNDMQDAAKFALQNYVATKDSETGKISKTLYKDVYFVHHPKANNVVSELLVAGYQKWAVSQDNSVRQAVDLMKEKGGSAEGLYLGGHSRGTLTLSNALQHLDKDKQNIGLLSNTTLKMVGPAANVTRADNILNRLQGRGDERLSKVGSIIIENSKYDSVGSSLFIGNNPHTIEINTLNKSKYLLLKDIVSNTSLSSHNCYGLGQPQCSTDGYRTNADNLIMQPEVTIFELNNKTLRRNDEN